MADPGESFGDSGLNGHGRSPALAAAEREIAAVKVRVDNLAAVGLAELEAMMRAGHERLASADELATRSALECFAVCYVMARALESARGELDALGTAALCYRQLGRPEVALVMLRACVELSARHGDAQGQAHALGNTALALRSLGRLEQALAMQRECARLALECGDWECAVRARVNLANLLLAPAAAPAQGEAAQPPAAGVGAPLSPRRDAVAQLRAALSLLDGRAAAEREEAPAAADAGVSARAELEVNVCTRLAACLEAEDEAHVDEINALYQRALTRIAPLIEGRDSPRGPRAAHYDRMAAMIRSKADELHAERGADASR